MRSWSAPRLPELAGSGTLPVIFDSKAERVRSPELPDGKALLYVCGITPYDATHIGHAFTYLAFDTLQRAWLDAGIDTVYVQNVTDVDDPLLERAAATGVDWRDLAAEQTALFRADMHQLGVLPPHHFVAVSEVVDAIADEVASLSAQGFAYRPDDSGDVYFDTVRADAGTLWRLGDVAHLDRETMLALSAERGGDPDRPGKRDRLDPLLWRGKREGEPSWPSVLGHGRPGWHIECAVIARMFLGGVATVQGGGADLAFPHHEFSAAHQAAAAGLPHAHSYCHTGTVFFGGHKMSKSLGNLVFVSRLLRDGADSSAIRLALLDNHYRADWQWEDYTLARASDRLSSWRKGLAVPRSSGKKATGVLKRMRVALADDLNTPQMLRLVDSAVRAGVDRPQLLRDAVQTLLGVVL